MALRANDQQIVNVANAALISQNWSLFEEVHPLLKQNSLSQKAFGCPEYAVELAEVVSDLVCEYQDAIRACDMSNWVETDGGRADAGHIGSAGDCAIRAISIACELSYQEVWLSFDSEDPNESPDEGIMVMQITNFLFERGWETIPLAQEGLTVKETAQKFKNGLITCTLLQYGHFVAAVNGKYYDTWNSGELIVKSIMVPPSA